MTISLDVPQGLPTLPDGWHYQPLESLLEPKGIAYGIVQPGAHDPSGVPIVRVKDLRDGRIDRGNALRVGREVEAKYDRTRLRGGEVLLSLVGSVGEVAVVPEDLAGWNVARAIAVMRPVRISSDWLKLYLTSDLAQGYMRDWQTTTVQATLNLRDLRRIPIAVPPADERKAITEVLGALDEKIAHNERVRQTTLSLAGACYEAAGTSGDTELIGDLAELFDGPHATPQKTEAGPWFLSISSLKNGYLDLAESAHLSEEDFPRWTRRVQPQAGDVLFSYETRLGDAALMPPDVRGSLGRRMALLRSKSASISGALLLHAYLSPEFQGEIRRRTIHGATVDRLPLKEMPNWRMPLPPESQRERLSAKLDALHACVTQTANENRTLADLRDTLLPQLLSGKLRVKDAARTVEEVA
ncbi:restriction endonuclease subunit S [Streptomyces sp. NPDC005202]|uniref:restriction endonuclease subunit S n=1 Tax=Streptomyces sp. NPDC005202 TaxID=3157021 RepID=UPI0033B7DDB2